MDASLSCNKMKNIALIMITYIILKRPCQKEQFKPNFPPPGAAKKILMSTPSFYPPPTIHLFAITRKSRDVNLRTLRTTIRMRGSFAVCFWR